MISDFVESPLAMEHQSELYGQKIDLITKGSHPDQKNGRCIGLKVKGTFDSQSGKLDGLENQKWMVRREKLDVFCTKIGRLKNDKSGRSSKINVDGPLNWIGPRKSQTEPDQNPFII